VPVLAAHVAGARTFGPRALYALWWATLALPAAQRLLRDETQAQDPAAGRAHAVWTWAPAVLALLHLWAVGYIHAIDFRPAFLAPLLLGLAATAGRDQPARQVVLPALAVLLSLGQGAALGLGVPGAGGTLSPLRLALLGAAATWAWLARRDREPWLGLLAAVSGAAGLLGSSVSSLGGSLARLLRFLGSLLPRDVFGWGVLAVVSAFVFLVAGARRSLRPDRHSRPGHVSPGAIGR
jgi:hypothetical protein